MPGCRPLHLALLMAATLPTGGCVAALVPLAAGGALAASERAKGADDPVPASPSASQAAAVSQEPQALPQPDAPGLGDNIKVLPTTVLPAPAPGGAAQRFGSYGAFHDAAEAFAQTRSGAPRQSALLADPGGMSAVTASCSEGSPAVLIDLDPDSGLLDLDARDAAAGLAQALASLRAQGVDVFWISEHGADAAGDIRRNLRDSGLDPTRRDPILLMRYPEDRKQTRRQDMAASHCLVAIAGDSRRDFDEMFAYLRDPNAPTPADPLLGTRWFLIPHPLD